MNDTAGKSTASGSLSPAPITLSRGEAISQAVFRGTLWVVAALALFLGGVYFANEKLWPYKPIEKSWGLLVEAWEAGGFAPENVVSNAPEHGSREAWYAHDTDELMSGYRAVTGYVTDADSYGVWLFDASGKKVHERILNYDSIDPDGPSHGSEAPHAFWLMPDGSAIVNTDKGDAIVRYDTCGEAIWSLEGAYHHSLAPDHEEGLWTWLGEVSTFDQYQTLVRFDPETGETLETIELFDDIIDASVRNRTIFSLVPDQTLRHYEGQRGVPDLFHPNDLEILSPELADAFEDFDAGDMLMSFRNLDLVIVVDRETYEIKWYSHGPWRRQHDPDFTVDGRISVYNNNPARPSSNIVIIDPTTRDLEILDIDQRFRFYSQYMGKHEHLDNGTVQITVPYEGRILETTADGRILLEMTNLFNDDHNAFVSDALWLPDDFFDTEPAGFKCDS